MPIKILKKQGRLHKKILFMMLIIGVVPIILAGLFALYSVTNSHRTSVTAIEENLVNQKIEETKAFLNDAVDTLKLRIGLTDIDKDFRDDLGNQTFLLTSLLNSNPAIKEASFIELSELRPNFGRETTRIIRDSENSDEFTLITKDITNEKQFLRDQRNLPKFTVARDEGQYIGPVYFTSSGPMITISALVKPNNNETKISILSAELSLIEITKIALRSKLGKSGYLYVVDSSERLIAPIGAEITTSNELVKSVISSKDENGQTARYKNFNNLQVVSYGEYIGEISKDSSDNSNLGWAVVAEWPAADADLIISNLIIQIIVFSFLVLVAVIILSVILAHKIVNPIKKLEEGTETVAKGKFDEPVNIKTGDEIEDLGVAFNKMTEGLKQLQALKDEFVFIAAHELKTPVAAIKGYLSIINDGLAGPVSDKVKEFIGKVLNANSRLIRLVEDLLEVARADAGKITIAVAPTDIAAVVNETISELKPLADEKAIKVTYNTASLGENIPKAAADGGRVREVLVNLIGNAIKYMGNRATEKTIDISHEVKDGMLVTHIKDNGLGMSKESQAKLFQKFYRVATKETATISGTGLGLFIVKQIIEKMNGTISVESEEGKGSTFSFSLPLA